MKIFITIPSFSINGGIRVIINWANYLSKNHEVYLHPLKGSNDYYNIWDSVKVTPNRSVLQNCDVMILTSPHSIHFENEIGAPKTFLFMQMCEHLFSDKEEWQKKCRQFYISKNPIILISKWNEQLINKEYERVGETHYIGNGIDFNDFPIENPKKQGDTVLIEGFIPGNPSKDSAYIGAKVGRRLKSEGYKVLAFSQFDSYRNADYLDEYHVRPSLNTMNDLYRRADILIKATHYDARSCSPMEAMTKGTVTARAINKGDDDLTHNQNCLRCDYNEEELYKISKELLTNNKLRHDLAENCLNYISKQTWKSVISQVEKIIC